MLIAHHLLLGDTLMLTALVAKLRAVHPRAHLAMTVPTAIAPLYATRPWGLEALPFDPRRPASTLWEGAAFDLAFVPGDNRYTWLAAAMRARWIVAFDGERRRRKSWPADRLVGYPDAPASWGDMVAALADGPPPPPYDPRQWPAPPSRPVDAPRSPYALLHVGASTPLKRWAPDRWLEVARALDARGLAPVWSCGPGERELVDACDPAHRYAFTGGALDLAQMRALLDRAALLVSPDTGIAHLGRIAGTPSVTLLGPGSAVLTGPGRYFAAMPWRAASVDPFPCRDQRILFGREIAWVRRCGRSPTECPRALCMDAVGVDAVLAAVDDALALPDPRVARQQAVS
ncbi:MAG: glycosyltransferase family 9 protein [Burkholderiales bacterium]